MLHNTRFQATLLVAAGALLGYLAASGGWRSNGQAEAATSRAEPAEPPAAPVVAAPAPCCDGLDRIHLLAQAGPSQEALRLLAERNQQVTANLQATGKKPNILVI